MPNRPATGKRRAGAGRFDRRVAFSLPYPGMPAQPHGDEGLPTRDRILATAARLFSEHGYEHTPLSQVAREAHVSKALVLWHFDSKENLFQAALGRTLEPYHIDVDDLAELDAVAQLEHLIDQFHEFVCDHGYSVRFLLGLIVHGDRPREAVLDRVGRLYDMFRSLLTEVIAHGRDSQRFRSDVEPSREAALILATLGGLLIERLMGHQADTDALVAHLKQTSVRRLIA